jgi:hypothetical protein
VAVSICSAVHLQRHASWLTSRQGWIAIGASAALIVRANLLSVPYGNVSIPIGPGVIYGTLRSVFERQLKLGWWSLTYGESEGRLAWILNEIDRQNPGVAFNRLARAARNFIAEFVEASAGHNAHAALEKEITAALGNPTEREKVKQLATYLSDEGYIQPLYQLIGRPPRNVVSTWRQR